MARALVVSLPMMSQFPTCRSSIPAPAPASGYLTCLEAPLRGMRLLACVAEAAVVFVFVDRCNSSTNYQMNLFYWKKVKRDQVATEDLDTVRARQKLASLRSAFYGGCKCDTARICCRPPCCCAPCCGGCRSISLARGASSSKPAACCCAQSTDDRQMDGHPAVRPTYTLLCMYQKV